MRSRKVAASATKPLTPTLSRKGRGGRSATVARSQRAAERLMQQRFFQRVEWGDFLLVEGSEAFGFFEKPVKSLDKLPLRLQGCKNVDELSLLRNRHLIAGGLALSSRKQIIND